MAAMTSLINEVREAMECSLCTAMFRQPIMLPCYHTFCLECLQHYGAGKGDGDVVYCPLCSKEFNVPTGGLLACNPNRFIERIIVDQSLSVIVNPFWDVSSNHVDDRPTPPTHVCDTHQDTKIELYCPECIVTICTKCYDRPAADEHSWCHIREEVGEKAGEGRNSWFQYKHLCEVCRSDTMETLVDEKTQLEVDSWTDGEPVQTITNVAEIGSKLRFRGTRQAATRITVCSWSIKPSPIPASRLLP